MIEIPPDMNSGYLILPVLVAVASSFWVFQNHQTITELEREIDTLQLKPATTATASAILSDPSQATPPGSKADYRLPDGTLDWRSISDLLRDAYGMNGSQVSPHSSTKSTLLLAQLDEAEILQGLRELDSLDLDQKLASIAESELLFRLSIKSPKSALEYLNQLPVDHFDKLHQVIGTALGEIAEKDPNFAIEAFEKMIAEGKLNSPSLDPTNSPRLDVEGSLISQLIRSDSSAALSRLQNLDRDRQFHILSEKTYLQRGEDPTDFIRLSRKLLPPKQASNAIIKVLGDIYHKSLDDLSNTLSNLPVSDQESFEIVEATIPKLAPLSDHHQAYQEIYHWAASQLPGFEAEIAVTSLHSDQKRWLDPQTSFERALTLTETLGDQKILSSFLQKANSPENPFPLSNQIKNFRDPDLAHQFQELINALPKTTPSRTTE